MMPRSITKKHLCGYFHSTGCRPGGSVRFNVGVCQCWRRAKSCRERQPTRNGGCILVAQNIITPDLPSISRLQGCFFCLAEGIKQQTRPRFAINVLTRSRARISAIELLPEMSRRQYFKLYQTRRSSSFLVCPRCPGP
jgi:hypothetical protein